MSEIEKRKAFLINVAYGTTVILLWYIAVKLLSSALLPFVLALVLTIGIQGIVEFLTKRLKIKRRSVSVITVLICYILVISALLLLGYFIFLQFSSLLKSLPSYAVSLSETVGTLIEKVNRFIGRMPDSTADLLGSFPEKAGESLTEGVTSLVGDIAKSAASGVPIFFISVVVTIVASAYFAKDYDLIRAYFIKNFSLTALNRIVEFKDTVFGSLFKIFKSYFIIMSVTFAELFLGFTVLGVKYSLITALVISLLDILPVLGCGTVLIPWGIISALNGNIKNAVGLVVIYLVITAVRHYIEPKVIGDKVGVHPLLMLLSVVLGLKLFGAVGVLFVPMTVIVLRNLPWHPKTENGATKN